MPALYSDALLAMGPEVQRLIADLDAANQHRQALLHDLEAQGDRADAVEALVEIHEAIARAALAVVTRGTPVTLAELMHAVDVRISRELVRERAVTARLAKQVEALLLDRQRETREANDRIRSWTAQHLDALTTELVHAQLDALRAKHAHALEQRRLADARSYELRIAEVEQHLMIRNRRATEALDERDIREAFAAGSEWQRSQRGQDVGAQIEPDEDQMIAASEQYARSKAGG